LPAPLASHAYGTLYIGVTSDLVRRVYEHREEKQIKKWNRDWKVNLIQKANPDWRDLYDEIVG
jgi:putative endonuclease